MKKFIKFNLNKILLIFIYVIVFYVLSNIIKNIISPHIITSQQGIAASFFINLGIYAILIISGLILLSNEIKTDLNVIKQTDAMKVFKWCLVTIGLAYAGNYIGSIISMIINGDDVANNQQTLETIFDTNFAIPMIFIVVFIGPIVEELVFRKSIHGVLRYLKFPKWVMIMISSIAFGAIHIDFTSLKDIVHILSYGAVGVAFAIMEEKTRNIIPCIIGHMFMNALSVAMMYALDIFEIFM